MTVTAIIALTVIYFKSITSVEAGGQAQGHP